MFTIYFRIQYEYFLARSDQKQAAEGGKYKTQTLPLRLFLIVSPFRVIPWFKWQGNIKLLGQLTGLYFQILGGFFYLNFVIRGYSVIENLNFFPGCTV